MLYSFPQGGILVQDIFPEGGVAKDGRLKFGDQILELSGEDFRNITHAKALAHLRLTPAKVGIVEESSTAGKAPTWGLRCF